MFEIKNWLRRKNPARAASVVNLSPEWLTLEKALHEHDFQVISACLRGWCLVAGHDLERLLKAATDSAFTDVDISKLAILYQHYSNHPAEAYAQAQQHLITHGFDVDLHVLSLICLYQNNQYEDAMICLQQLSAVEMLGINRSDYWQMVTAIRWANNDMMGLAQAVERSLDFVAPGEDAVLQVALSVFIELGIQDKIDWIRTRLAELPPVNRYSHSLSLLALGEFADGWRQMEARYDIEDSHRYINKGLRAFPRWKGEPLNQLRLLVSSEQGFGDTVQMCRYLPLLCEFGVQQILIETQPETLTLLQFNFPDIMVIERQWSQAPTLKFDRWIGMMSLPYYLNAWGQATPGQSGYLKVPTENVDYWHQRVADLSPTKRPKVGLAWSGQPAHRADRRRSVPIDLMMANVKSVDVVFFALQTKVPETLPANVINVSEEMITLADTAALIAEMDLVITVDTSVVHIAGALGKETWLLLPKRYEWRWGLEGETNDWYDSVKIMRQTEHANWQSVLTEVFECRLPARFNH